MTNAANTSVLLKTNNFGKWTFVTLGEFDKLNKIATENNKGNEFFGITQKWVAVKDGNDFFNAEIGQFEPKQAAQ